MNALHHRDELRRGWRPRGAGRFALALVVVLLVSTVVSLVSLSTAHAAGDVTRCTERSLEDALLEGGLIKFTCSGVIMVSSTKVITRNTTLDATGQRVAIGSKTGEAVFEVQPGIRFMLNNLVVFKTGLEGISRLPATGYPPPPNEWLIVALGGLALVVVSIVAGIVVRARPRFARKNKTRA